MNFQNKKTRQMDCRCELNEGFMIVLFYFYICIGVNSTENSDWIERKTNKLRCENHELNERSISTYKYYKCIFLYLCFGQLPRVSVLLIKQIYSLIGSPWQANNQNIYSELRFLYVPYRLQIDVSYYPYYKIINDPAWYM